MWAWVGLLYSFRQIPHKSSSKLATHIVPVVDMLLYPSHNTSRGKSQVLGYIRHKWVIDKSLPTPHACAPFIQPKHLTCVSYSFNIWLALCPAHHIAPDCWTFRPKPPNLSSVRWSERWDTQGQNCVCVCVCILIICSCVVIMCLIFYRRITILKQRSPEAEGWIKIMRFIHYFIYLL